MLVRPSTWAVLKPWPKMFQNLRSTRETELADDFPIQVVCDWIGNTETVASKHYLQVTEDHFAKALQNALQHPAVLPRTGPQPELAAHKKTPVLQGFAAGCEVVQSGRVEDRGLEPLASFCGDSLVSRQDGAESGAVETGLYHVVEVGRMVLGSTHQIIGILLVSGSTGSRMKGRNNAGFVIGRDRLQRPDGLRGTAGNADPVHVVPE